MFEPGKTRTPEETARIAWLRENYYRDPRCFDKEPKAPRDQWWMVGKLFRKTVRGWMLVHYDSHGHEIGVTDR